MSWRITVGDDRPRAAREHTIWRVLVGVQATVWIAILVTLLVVFLVGLFGSLFVQRSI